MDPPNNKSHRGSSEQSTVASNITWSPQEKEHRSHIKKHKIEGRGGENLIKLRSNIRVYIDLSRFSQTLHTRWKSLFRAQSKTHEPRSFINIKINIDFPNLQQNHPKHPINHPFKEGFRNLVEIPIRNQVGFWKYPRLSTRLPTTLFRKVCLFQIFDGFTRSVESSLRAIERSSDWLSMCLFLVAESSEISSTLLCNLL